MIKILDGDLLESNATIIAHQVNCQGKFNSGVAKEVRKKYWDVYVEYKSLCDEHLERKEELLGECQLVCVDNKKYVANLFGQLGYGYDGKQYTDINALKKAMIKLKSITHFAMKPENITIAFPYGLGSVRGGAKWENVYGIIEEVFRGYNIEIWRLDKG